MKEAKIEYISDIIKEKDIETWDEKNVLISTPVGSGKTTLILTILYDYAKSHNRKILLLEPRTDLKDDVVKKVENEGKADVITVVTFHKLEMEDYELSKYYYIVIDECHYFLHDSGVNKQTDISYLKILQAKATKIYMSGTATRIKKFMKDYDNVEFIEYPLTGKPQIENVWFYDKLESLDWLMATTLKQNSKGLFFINDLAKAAELYERYKEQAIFCCSKWQKKYSKYRNEKEIAEMLDTHTLGDKSILITTTTLDVGISIIDPEISTIVMYGIDDLATIHQCFGRKRWTDDDYMKPSVYIHKCTNSVIGGRMTALERSRKRALNLLRAGEEKYLKAFKRNEADEYRIIYDTWNYEENKLEKHINQVRLFNVECQIADYRRMLDVRTDGFRQVVTESFGKTEYLKLDDEKESALFLYLDTLCRSGEKFLDKKAHDELAQTINVNINGRLCKTINTINSALKNDLKMPFEIKSTKTHRTVNGVRKKYDAAWQIVRI